MASPTQIRIPLQGDFRYLHEPLSDELSKKWAVGRSKQINELADRIVLAHGGAFLLSGVRGVGKTTFVRSAMRAIRTDKTRYKSAVGEFELVDVWLNLARPIEPEQLLHLLMRHLYLRLKETGLLSGLSTDLQHDLRTAFLRTSFEISSRSIASDERSGGFEVGTGKAPWLGIELLGKMSGSRKQTRSDEDALKYLPYDEKAAEFELLNFSRRLLSSHEPPPLTRWQRFFSLFGTRYNRATPIKVVFVLDELDKLETFSGPDKASPLAPILLSLKNVLSASGLSFVFIAGKEAEERLIEDVSHGDSLYESIFSYNLYLPCLWADQDEMVQRCLAVKEGGDPEANVQTFTLFMRYKGRGIPRRTWRELNKYVNWSPDLPTLNLEVAQARYIKMFAKLESSIRQDELFLQSSRIADEVSVDRKRLFFYYIADWILTRDRDPFNEKEIIEVVKNLNLGGAITEVDAAQIARSTIRLLLSRVFIERADEDAARFSASAETLRYRVCPWVVRALEGLPERQPTPKNSPTTADEDIFAKVSTPAQPQRIGEYQIIEQIGSGGSSLVYKVRHPFTAGTFAAKLLRNELITSTFALKFFEREIQSIKQMNHPQLVRVHDVGKYEESPYYIMDLLDGLTLATLLDNLKTLEIEVVCRILRDVSAVSTDLHSKGLFRIDIKPSNIFLTRDGNVKLLDLGILVDEKSYAPFIEPESYIVGSPGFMAPEQMLDPQSIDRRIDVYSIGMVLYQSIVGELPFPPDASMNWLGLSNSVPPITDRIKVPAKLGNAISRMVARDRADRFQTMTEVTAALAPFGAPNTEAVLKALEKCTTKRATSGSATELLSGLSAVRPMAPPPPYAPARAISGSGPGEFTLMISGLGTGPVKVPPPPAPPQTASNSTPPERAVVRPDRAVARLGAEPQDNPVGPLSATGMFLRAFDSGEKPNLIPEEEPNLIPEEEPNLIPEEDPTLSSEEGPTPSSEEKENLRWAENSKLIWRIRTGNRLDQESALRALTLLTGCPELAFDFLYGTCIWSGLDSQNRTISFDKSSLILGRSASEVDLLIEDPTISRQHVAFFVSMAELGSVIAEDLSSASGSLINGVSFARRKLSDSDTLTVGAMSIHIHILAKNRPLEAGRPDEIENTSEVQDNLNSAAICDAEPQSDEVSI